MRRLISLSHLYYKKVTATILTVCLGEYYCICENSHTKPFVAPEEASCNLINDLTEWLSCIMGNVDGRFERQTTDLHCTPITLWTEDTKNN